MFTQQVQLARYNELAIKFLQDRCAQGCQILCVRQVNRGRFEDMLFYKWENDETIHTATLPQKNSGGHPVYFGDLTHYIKTIYADVYGYPVADICQWYDGRNYRRIERTILKKLEFTNPLIQII